MWVSNGYGGMSVRRRLKLIYNPEAGGAVFKSKLDQAINILQAGGWQVLTYRTRGNPEETAYEAETSLDEGCEAIVAVGGDGTLHQVINGLLRLVNSGKTPPALGIIPAGTANDLATYMRIPKDVEGSCRIIVNAKKRWVDVGQVGGERYFFNVASGGMMTDVSHKVEPVLKHNLGKLAYYLKAIEQLPEFRPFSLTVRSSANEVIYEGETLLFLVLNSAGAGSFPLLAPSAKTDDGLLDLVVFQSCGIGEFVGLFLRVLRGEHLKSPLVTYHQGTRFFIHGPEGMETDLDGEVGPPLPWDISVCPACLSLFVP